MKQPMSRVKKKAYNREYRQKVRMTPKMPMADPMDEVMGKKHKMPNGTMMSDAAMKKRMMK